MTDLYVDELIYLDHAATTPVDPAVVAAMLPYFTERYGNPSSIYRLGQDARAALDDARSKIAGVLGCTASEILITSGATESDNLALRGVVEAWKLSHGPVPIPHVITTAIEHHAVLRAAQGLERWGVAVTYLPCDSDGMVSVTDVEAAVRPETCLISVMYANNEVGAIQPVEHIGEVAREHAIPFHTDAVQAAGALPVRVDDLRADLLSLSAHKFYGPKGIGALYIRKGTPIAFSQQGGGQEGGRRGGTENVPLAIGMAVALELAEDRRPEFVAHCTVLRDYLWEGIRRVISGVSLNGPPVAANRLANNLNVALPSIQGETILLGLDMEGIAVSAGSACTTGNTEPSHVLRALGLSDERCRASLRFTLGWQNSMEQIHETIDVLVEIDERVRALAGEA
ncbi:MAG: cysteine desulfurase [Chloroflexia bacterium]|nr:cysteine desulfurase [Chloroflexia bacterium]